MSLLTEQDALLYRQIIDYLVELGYVPQKQKVRGYVLSFRHGQSNKVIAKAGVSGGKDKRPFVSIKFFDCKSVPVKYCEALRHEIESHGGRYCGPLRSNIRKNACGRCPPCTGDGLGYYYVHPDGREVLRCGAYPIVIPDLTPHDIDHMKQLILEQHSYFLSMSEAVSHGGNV